MVGENQGLFKAFFNIKTLKIMNESLIYSILFMAIGLFAIIGSVTNWDYFLNHRKAQLFIKLLGRQGTRIFYVILGLGLFSVGILSLLGIISLNN